MTPEERTLLTQFLQDLEQARGGPKDAEAEAMIAQALARNPDGAYLLVQHAILADQALHAAQDRIAALESQARAPAPAASFLGGAQSPWQSPGATAVPPTQSYGQPASPFSASPFSNGGGLGSFLRNAGTTAAGVVGGEMLFEGLSGLFGGHRGFGGGFGGGYGAPVENVTINEYNDGGSADYDGGSADYGDGGTDWGGGSDDI
jgi:hypothetical protein